MVAAETLAMECKKALEDKPVKKVTVDKEKIRQMATRATKQLIA